MTAARKHAGKRRQFLYACMSANADSYGVRGAGFELYPRELVAWRRETAANIVRVEAGRFDSIIHL